MELGIGGMNGKSGIWVECWIWMVVVGDMVGRGGGGYGEVERYEWIHVRPSDWVLI